MNPSKIVKVTVQQGTGGLQPMNIGIPCFFAEHKEVIKTGEGENLQPKFAARTLHAYGSLTDVLNDVADDSDTYASAVRWFGNGGSTLYVYYMETDGESVQTATAAFNAAVAEFELIKSNFFAFWFSKDLVTADTIDSLAGLASTTRLFGADVTTVDTGKKVTNNPNAAIGFVKQEQIADSLPNAYAFAGIAALMSQVNYQGVDTAITAELKTINGQSSTPLKKSEIDDIEAANLYYITNVGADDSVLLHTTTTQKNHFIDRTYDLASMTNALQVAPYNLLRRTPTKVPLTANGYQQLIDVGSQVMNQYVRNGVLGGGRLKDVAGLNLDDSQLSQWQTSGFVCLSKREDFGNLPDSNVEARKHLPVKFKPNFASGTHSAEYIIEVI